MKFSVHKSKPHPIIRLKGSREDYLQGTFGSGAVGVSFPIPLGFYPPTQLQCGEVDRRLVAVNGRSAVVGHHNSDIAIHECIEEVIKRNKN